MKLLYVTIASMILMTAIGLRAEEADTVKTKEVLVIGKRTAELYVDKSRNIELIGRADISKTPVMSIESLLEYSPGVDIRQRGAYGMQSDISLRGGSFNQTLVMLNGFPVNDPQTGHHNCNFPIDSDNVQEIEILKGPGARVLGPNAFSGAVNIITGCRNNNNLRVSLSGGENDLYKAGISANIQSGSMSNYFSIGKNGSGPYIENTDFQKSNVFYQGSYQMDNSNIGLQAGYTDKAFGANCFYTAKYPNQFEQTQTAFTGILYNYFDENFKISPKAYWRRHYDRFELFRDNPADWYSGHNYHKTDVLGAGITANYYSAVGISSLGFDFRNEHILSNVLGNDMNEAIEVSGEDNAWYTKQDERNNINVFFEHAIEAGNVNLSTGMLMHKSSNYDWSVYPGIDMSYLFSDELRIFASVNKSMRIPTFTELYYQGPTNLGNPDLKPEQAISIESGIKYSAKSFNLTLSLFRRDADNLIDWVKMEDTLIWESKNLTEIITNGFEFSGKYCIDMNIFEYLRLNSLSLSYSYISPEKYSGKYISYYAMDFLKHKISMSLNMQIVEALGLNFKYTYQDRNGTYTSIQTGLEEEYKAVNLLDCRLSYTYYKYKFFVDASNILNEKYNDISNVIMPGRWLRAGIVADIDL